MVSKLKAWFGLVFNAASFLALATLLADVTGYLALFQWSVFVSTKNALLLAMAMNLANIVLRFVTASGVREEEKNA